MAKKRNTPPSAVVVGKVSEVRPAKATQKKAKKRPSRKGNSTTRKKATTKRAKKEDTDVTALITQGADIGRLVQSRDRDDLTAWLNVYMSVEVEPGSNTYRAKLGDIQWFLRFFFESTSGYECDQWTRALTKSFQTWIQKQKSERTGKRLAPNTCRRITDTMKRAAKWIHRQRPFMAGYPFQDIKQLKTDEPAWRGLSGVEVRRLRAAAEQLIQMETREDQLPKRNYAILRVLLDAGLRAFELSELELENYDDRSGCLRNIPRKGRDHVTGEIPLSSDTAEAVDEYLESERPEGPGPLFQSKNGKPISQQVVDLVVRRIAAHANSKLSAKNHIDVSPHVLRHTSLRKWAEKKGVRYAREVSGQVSDRYIWRYTQPSRKDIRDAAEELWD